MPLQPHHKAAQALPARFLKLHRQIRKGCHIPQTHLPIRHGACDRSHIQIVHNAQHQLAHGEVGGNTAPAVQLFQKRRGLGHSLRRFAQGIVIAALFVCPTNLCQLVGGKAKIHRTQSGNQGHILHGIVRHCQQRQQIGNLAALPEAAPLLIAHGNPSVHKGTTVYAAHRIGRAHENGNVSVSGRTHSILSTDKGSRFHQLTNGLRHKVSLYILQGGAVLLRIQIPIDETQGRHRHIPFIARTAAESGIVIVFQFPQLGGHNVFKHTVGSIQHPITGTEVFLQQDPSGRAHRCVFVIVIGQILFRKNSGVRQTEAVNGLFHVTYGKQIPRILGYTAENQLLHRTDVLIFVHHDFGVPFTDLCRKGCGASVGLSQQPRRKMLQIPIVHQPAALLFLGKDLVKFQGQLQQRLHGGSGLAHIRQDLLAALPEVGFEALYRILAGSAVGLESFQHLGMGRLSGRVQAWEGNVAVFRSPLPAQLRRCGKSPQPLGGFGKVIRILGGDIIIVGMGHFPQHPFHNVGPIIGRLGGAVQQVSAPDRLTGVGNALGIQGIALLLRPYFGIGMALHFAVQIQNQRSQTSVISPRTYGIDEGTELFIGFNAVIAGLHDLFQRRPLHHRRAALVHHLEIGRQLQRQAVFTNQRGAESVNGADLGSGQQRILTAQRGIVGLLGHAFGKLLHNTAAQLPCGSTGKGNNQKAVNAFGVFPRDIGHQALGQHLGFAGACRSGNQQGAATGINGPLLVLGGCKFSHLPALLPS